MTSNQKIIGKKFKGTYVWLRILDDYPSWTANKTEAARLSSEEANSWTRRMLIKERVGTALLTIPAP